MFTLRKKTPAVEFAPDNAAWGAFAGACRFRDGTPPLFAELTVPDLPLVELEEPDPILVAIVDEQEPELGRFETTLTLNGCDALGHPVAYARRFPAELVGREKLLQWARGNLRPTMSHGELLLAGFAFESYGAEIIPGWES